MPRPGAETWRRAAAALLAGVCMLLLAACGPAPVPVATAPSAATLERGRAIYNFRCYFCHGYSGDAKTLAATYLQTPPRDFRATRPQDLPREAMLAAIRDGRPGTAMKGFRGILDEAEMQAVAEFVRDEFMEKQAPNTRYHTRENGWPDHERHAAAFPFARGEIAIDTPWEQLTMTQQQGLRLFRSACISCHDHGRVNDPGQVWESRPVSFPRDAYCASCHQDVPRSEPQGVGHPQRAATHTFAQRDGSVPLHRPERAEAQLAANYTVHDRAPVLAEATPQERRGEHLYQRNCAFCHAADGSAKGWIGSFLEPHPRDLTSPGEMRGMTRERLLRAIAQGLPGTSMPAWQGVLPPADIEAVASYVARVFQPAAER
jgi:cytochrome c oxidase cbb3-type subunit 3